MTARASASPSPRVPGDTAGDPLPPEVAAALRAFGYTPERVARLPSSRPASHPRAAFRVDLACGGTVKLRRVEDDETARRLLAIRRHLPAAFAPALGRHANVLLEEWIDGEPLADRVPGEIVLLEAGRALAQLHRSAPPPAALPDASAGGAGATESAGGAGAAGSAASELAFAGTAPIAVAPAADPWRAKGERALHDLASRGAIAAREACTLADALRREAPARVALGLVHTDFCGDNLVVDRAGRLRVVDNERLALDALAYDLGRSWYRWPLPRTAWDRFAEAYAAELAARSPHAPIDGDVAVAASPRFWRIVAAAEGATIRLRHGFSDADVALARLRSLAADRAP